MKYETSVTDENDWKTFSTRHSSVFQKLRAWFRQPSKERELQEALKEFHQEKRETDKMIDEWLNTVKAVNQAGVSIEKSQEE